MRIARFVATLLAFLTMGPKAEAADYALLVGGMGGEPKYRDEFHSTLSSIRDSLLRGGYEASKVTLLTESIDGTGQPANTLQSIESAFAMLSEQASSSDTLLLIMLGHGQSDFVEPKFNLPGADLSAQRLGQLLGGLPMRDQRLVLCFACSGHFSEILADGERTIVASTESARQLYHTVASPYLAETFASSKADLDANGILSAYELFEFLTTSVAEHFNVKNLLPTEAPSLEDNGNGAVSTRNNEMSGGDGERSRSINLCKVPIAASGPTSIPAEGVGP